MDSINLGEILVVNTTGILVLLILLLSRFEKKAERSFMNRLFDTMIILTFGALVVETLTFVTDGLPGLPNRIFSYLGNAYLFFASNSVGALWVLYVDYRIYHSMKRLRRTLGIICIPYLIICVLLVCDLFGAGYIFRIDENNRYVRGRFVMLSYGVLFLHYIYTIVLAVVAARRREHAYFFPVYYFVLPCLAGTIVQGMFYGLAAGWLSVSLSFLFVQVQLQNMNAYVDDLSGLFNRKYYNFYIRKLAKSRKDRTIYGIMIDVNHFKRINDEFGHTMGDSAIAKLGDILSTLSTERNTVIRLAGDEFFILCDHSTEQEVQALIRELQELVDKFNAASGMPYEISLAIGYSASRTANLNSDDFLHRVDMKMYEAKADYYSASSRNRRRPRPRAEQDS